MDSYVDARLAEISNRDADALKTYLKLHSKAPTSEVLADRLYTSAIRAGDMAAAVRAVRAQELQGASSNEAPLILFADAFQRKNWAMATLATKELERESYFGFMAPILQSWVAVAQRKPFDLEPADPDKEPYLAYYSGDQRVYLDIASGNTGRAKISLRAFAMANTSYARDLLIRAAPIYAAKGEQDFAAALLNTTVDRDYADDLIQTKSSSSLAKFAPQEGIAALHVRIAETLLDQKNGEAALVFARIANWLAPNDASAKLMLANILVDQGLDEPATALRQSILPSSPYWPRAVGDTIRQYGQDDRPNDAVKLAESARKLRPRSANMALLLAQSYDGADDRASAIEVYRQLAADAETAKAMPTQLALYYYMLATALDNGGNWPEAKAELEKAQKLDPKNPAILNYLGYSLLEKNEDAVRGSELVVRAFELSPRSVAITDSLGWSKYMLGQYGDAVVLLEQAAQEAGNDRTINEHLGDAYWRAGRKVDARYAWRVAAQVAENDAAQRLAAKLDVGLPEPAKKR